jgi:hypothetical protein
LIIANDVSEDWFESLTLSYERSNRISSPALQEAVLLLLASAPVYRTSHTQQDVLWGHLLDTVPFGPGGALMVVNFMEKLAEYSYTLAELVRLDAVYPLFLMFTVYGSTIPN